MSRLLWVSLVIGAAAAGYWLWPADANSPVRSSPVNVSDLLRGDNSAGYARATAPRHFSFPKDHGPHDDFRQEWWYYTGNLTSAEGRHFGYQLTFFRYALAPQPVPRGSAWATRQIYLVHFAVTDVRAGRFYSEERTSRAALGLAGAGAVPFKVWVEDWIAQGEGAQGLPMHVHAAGDAMAIDLHLNSAKPAVPQGDDGLSQKGEAPGNASYYYSLTRLSTQGSVRIGQETFAVQGLSWMDHEWSTSILEPEQSGWDWFALQFSDRRELMFYRLRRKDGSTDAHSRGVIVDSRGGIHALPASLQITATADWTSPHSGVRYPAAWTLNDPAEGLSLTVTPYLADQELNHRFRYWEGAVRAAGLIGGQAVRGEGYVELVGYRGAAAAGHDTQERN